VLGREADAARARRKLGEVLHDLNRADEALSMHGEALALYERQGDRAGQAEAHQAIAAVHASRYDFAAAAPHLEAALALWPADREDAGLARLLLEVARAKTLAGDGSARALAERGAALAERLREPDLQARGLYVLALAHAHHGAPLSTVVALSDRAETLACRVGDRDTLLRVCNNRAEARHARGDLAGARADLEQAIALAEQLDVAGLLAHLCQNLAEDCRRLGAWAEGRANARRAYELGSAHTVLHLLAWMEGDPAHAVRMVEEALDDGRGRGDVQRTCDLLAILADWRLERGEAAAALAPAREAFALLDAHALASITVLVRGPLAEASAATGAPDAAAVLAEAMALMERHEAYLARPQLLRADGLLRARAGRTHDAVATLRESAEVARAQGALPQLGRTLAALRDIAAAIGDTALAAEAEAERARAVARIGLEAHALAWATAPGDPIPN